MFGERRIHTLCAIAALAVVSVPGPLAAQPSTGLPGDHLIIEEVVIDLFSGANGQLIIKGKFFDFRNNAQVTLGELATPLNVVSVSFAQIIADLPPGPVTGDHLLTVSTGEGTSRYDEYDLTFGMVGPQGPPGATGAQGPPGEQGEPGATDASGLVFYETESVSMVIPMGSFQGFERVSCEPGDVALGPSEIGIQNMAVPFFDVNAWKWSRSDTSTIDFFYQLFDTCNQSIGCILASDLKVLCLDATP